MARVVTGAGSPGPIRPGGTLVPAEPPLARGEACPQEDRGTRVRRRAKSRPAGAAPPTLVSCPDVAARPPQAPASWASRSCLSDTPSASCLKIALKGLSVSFDFQKIWKACACWPSRGPTGPVRGLCVCVCDGVLRCAPGAPGTGCRVSRARRQPPAPLQARRGASPPGTLRVEIVHS